MQLYHIDFDEILTFVDLTSETGGTFDSTAEGVAPDSFSPLRKCAVTEIDGQMGDLHHSYVVEGAFIICDETM